MKRAIVALTLLAGCAPDPQKTFNSAFPNYQDKPVQHLMERWGPPEQALPADGGTVYTWRNAPAASCRAEAHVNGRGNVIGVRYRGQPDACDGMMLLLH